jgi:cold shock CspA family protein
MVATGGAGLGRSLAGTVREFDAEVGLGSVALPDGGSVPFHCTELTDGSRDVAVGTGVSVMLRPGHLGRWEAVAVTPAPAGSAWAGPA